MGAPDQPRDDHGRWTAGASAGDHQASQSKPIGPGRQPRTPHTPAPYGTVGRKAEHDAGMQARLDAYAQAHGGKQAENASGTAKSWRPSTTMHTQKSVGTGGGSGGGGSGGGRGGGSAGGGFGHKRKSAKDEMIAMRQQVDERHKPTRTDAAVAAITNQGGPQAGLTATPGRFRYQAPRRH